MSEQNVNHEEHDENVEEGQEQLEGRPQDEIDGDKVKIPKQDFNNLKKQLKSANQESKERRQQIEALEAKLAEMEESLSATKGSEEDDSKIDRKELEKQRKSIEQKYKSQLEEKQNEIMSMQTRLEKTLIESAAREAIVSEKGVPDLILDHATRSAKLFQNDRGGYDVRIVDENGEAEFNDRGEYMTIHDHVKSLKQHEIFGRAFEATVKQGTGMQDQKGNRKPQASVTKSQLRANPKAQKEFIAKYCKDGDMSAYANLPE